jgi:aryl-alcohol dehydrogenase-like predicted oxidoreductase
MHALNHYRMLGRSGLRVSPLCFGTMTMGQHREWATPPDDCRRMIDMYADAGGNFLDTANIYHSEEVVGECIADRRDRFVVSTKYTFGMDKEDANYSGNNRKSLRRGVEDSLRKLKTDYIDLLFVHFWEFRTPVEELMRGLDDVIASGKVLYIAASNFPAWKIAQANTLADQRGWNRFIGVQARYSLAERTAERDIVPMSMDLGLTVLPWGPLGSGVLSGKYKAEDKVAADAKVEADGTRRPQVVKTGLTDRNLAIVSVVDTVAQELGATHAQVALRWLMQKPGRPLPVIGARTPEQLEDNMGAVSIELSDEQMARLDKVSGIELGYPHDIYQRLAFMRGAVDGSHNVEGGWEVS